MKRKNLCEHPENLFTTVPVVNWPDIYQEARNIRQLFFGSKVFMYGFLYISTFCRNNCSFCLYRKNNKSLPRFRKTVDEIVSAAYSLAEDGVHLLDLTMGEDADLVEESNIDHLANIIFTVRRESGLPVMVSPGVLAPWQLAVLKEAGADWYACYQETYSRKLFATLRPSQDFDMRFKARAEAANLGMLVEDGILAGVGENNDDLSSSLLEIRKENCAQVRAMSYVAHKGGLPPAISSVEQRKERELNLIAAMRLLMPENLIPASLDVEGISGLRERLRAGANVVTSILPDGFSGVATHPETDFDPSRSVLAVKKVLEEEGLQLASRADFADFMYMAGNRIDGESICV